MDNCFYIYQHICPNGKVYIGQTGRLPEDRWCNGNGYRGSTIFYNAIKKYGWNNIKHIVLFENLSKEDADRIEIELIKKYQEQGICYNIREGGNGDIPHRFNNRKTSEETKRKQSLAHMGRKLSEEHKAKIRESCKGINLGRRHSIETRLKIGNRPYPCGKDNHMFGKHILDYQKDLISEANGIKHKITYIPTGEVYVGSINRCVEWINNYYKISKGQGYKFITNKVKRPEWLTTNFLIEKL